MTLGSGTAATSLFAGAVFGYELLWVAPVAMLFGILRFAHFAHGDLMTLGAYFGLSMIALTGLPAIAALPVAMVLTAFMAEMVTILLMVALTMIVSTGMKGMILLVVMRGMTVFMVKMVMTTCMEERVMIA